MSIKSRLLSVIFASAALPLAATSASAETCTIRTAKQSVSADTLCACQVVDARMIRYLQRRADFEDILARTLDACPAFAAVLTDVQTASITDITRERGDGPPSGDGGFPITPTSTGDGGTGDGGDGTGDGGDGTGDGGDGTGDGGDGTGDGGDGTGDGGDGTGDGGDGTGDGGDGTGDGGDGTGDGGDGTGDGGDGTGDGGDGTGDGGDGTGDGGDGTGDGGDGTGDGGDGTGDGGDGTGDGGDGTGDGGDGTGDGGDGGDTKTNRSGHQDGTNPSGKDHTDKNQNGKDNPGGNK